MTCRRTQIFCLQLQLLAHQELKILVLTCESLGSVFTLLPERPKKWGLFYCVISLSLHNITGLSLSNELKKKPRQNPIGYSVDLELRGKWNVLIHDQPCNAPRCYWTRLLLVQAGFFGTKPPSAITHVQKKRSTLHQRIMRKQSSQRLWRSTKK